MTTKLDDLEAVRQIADTLQPFSDAERERILRWSRERLGMNPAASSQAPFASLPPSTPTVTTSPAGADLGQDIASFVAKKAPRSDVHFAATVAFYYQFVAPLGDRKDAITKENLVDACRKATRKRPKRPAQVLVNAYHEGFLDRGERGLYRLNSVGENLVAMVLPADGDARAARETKAGKARTGQTGRRRAKAKKSRSGR